MDLSDVVYGNDEDKAGVLGSQSTIATSSYVQTQRRCKQFGAEQSAKSASLIVIPATFCVHVSGGISSWLPSSRLLFFVQELKPTNHLESIMESI